MGHKVTTRGSGGSDQGEQVNQRISFIHQKVTENMINLVFVLKL